VHQGLAEAVVCPLYLAEHLFFPVRQPDHAVFIGKVADYELANPPARICAETHVLFTVEFFRRVHKPHVPFLDKIHELNIGSRIGAGNFYNQPQIRLNQFLQGFFITLV